MAREYDVYLNSKGYRLARRLDGQLQSGAAREQLVDPFSRFLSSAEKYAKASFRFGDGGGLAEYDGSHRYESAGYADTRGGHVVAGPIHHRQGAGDNEAKVRDDSTLVAEVLDNSGSQHGLAQRFQTYTGQTTIRSVAVLVRRKATQNYATAATFTVAIYEDTAGPKPGTLVGSVAATLRQDADRFLPWPDRWRAHEWFWLELTFASALTVTESTYYWFAVQNSQVPPLWWAENQDLTGYERSSWNGTAWTNSASDYRLMFKLKYGDEIDGFARCFCEFKGSDNYKRLYAGLGYKVMYYAEHADKWENSKTLTAPVLQLLEFGSKMFAAQGPAEDMWYTDGASAGSTWTQVTGEQASALAIHDNMLWKADVASVNGSTDGTTWTGAAVTVGDPGSDVMSMVSHGGKLFACKPEGVFEISYPDTYPGSGTPACNLMLDFHTELGPRPFALDWHSGLYFPGYAGVYELKSSLLRNCWTERIDEGANEILPGEQEPRPSYDRPRTWSPLYDARAGGFAAACGTSRGIYVAYAHPFMEMSDVWFYDGRNWHELGPLSLHAMGYDAVGEYCLAIYLQDRGGGRGRLWMGFGMDILRWEWPTWTSDRLQDPDSDYVGSAQFDPAAYVITPWFALKDKQPALAFAKVGVAGKQGETGNTVYVRYRIDNATSWTLLGYVDLTTMYNELSFPSGTSGRRIQLKAELDVWAGNEISARLDQIDLMYQPIPEDIQTFQVTIHAAHALDRRSGTPDRRSAAKILSDLRALLALTSPFTYEDPTGTSHTVRATGMSIQHIRHELQPGEPAPTEAYAIVSMLAA